MEWKAERFFSRADDYYASLLESLAKAQKSIEFETYIYEKSLIGARIIEALKAASDRGVRVHLMVDGVGSLNFFKDYGDSLGNIKVKVYHPIPGQKWSNRYIEPTPQKWHLGRLYQTAVAMNARDHRKVCVIDNEVAYLGSYNVTDVHLEEVKGDKAWRDFGICVEGPCVELLHYSFERAWNNSLTEKFKVNYYKTPEKLRKYRKYFLLNYSTSSRMKTRNRFLTKITTAKNRIWLVTPYFIPTFRLVRSLSRAAKEGLDVRLIIPRNNDIVFMHWAMKSYYKILLRHGVKIYEYLPSVLHAKTSVIDDWCAVGSTNLNSRSIFHDLEANYVLQTQDAKRELYSAIEEVLKKSEKIEDVKTGPWYERVMGQIFLVFRYWM